MDHAERMKEKIRGLEKLLDAENNKSSSSQNRDFIRNLETEIRGLKLQLAGGR